MVEIIEIDDKTRIRRIDRQNVIVETLSKNGGWNCANGNGRGPYLPDVQGAIAWLLDHQEVDKGTRASLKEALVEYERVAAKLEKALRKS